MSSRPFAAGDHGRTADQRVVHMGPGLLPWILGRRCFTPLLAFVQAQAEEKVQQQLAAQRVWAAQSREVHELEGPMGLIMLAFL